LEPELAVIVGRLIRSGIPPNEAEGETLAAAWEVVTGRSKAKGPARLETIWTRARTATGLRRRCPVEVVPIPDGFDAADPKSDPPQGWPAVLAAAEAAGVLTPRQVVIVARTRVEGCSVAEVARALGLAPKTVYKDRDRAENALAAFARSYDDSESGR
jgi:DNA-directed RNA polymerase specialized sigma24 family protein